MKEKLLTFATDFENYLEQCFAHAPNKYENLYSAMEYSILNGGKRLRPFILNEFYKLNGGDDKACFDFCVALEMIHVYSLIHDDLPCMDDDDFRRGKPSLHKAFGEDIALLAGDGLLTFAFETAAATKNIPADRVIKAVSYLAKCAGKDGMIGGQVIDLESEKVMPSADTVLEMYSKKTGRLISAAAVIGTILAGGNEEKIAAAKSFADSLGIAFQIKDDILDIIGDSALLGKPVGSDSKNEKSTYVSLIGPQKAEIEVESFTNKAISSLEIFGEGSKTLKELALYLVDRSY